MAKKYQKSQRQKGVFACIFYENKRKTVVRRAEVEIFYKNLNLHHSLCSFVRLLRHTLVLASHGENLILNLNYYKPNRVISVDELSNCGCVFIQQYSENSPCRLVIGYGYAPFMRFYHLFDYV